MIGVVRFVIAMLSALLLARPAFAYIGPGAGLGVLAAFWALVTAVVSSIAFLILWPLRNRFRRGRMAADDSARGRAEGPQRVSDTDIEQTGAGGRSR